MIFAHVYCMLNNKVPLLLSFLSSPPPAVTSDLWGLLARGLYGYNYIDFSRVPFPQVAPCSKSQKSESRQWNKPESRADAFKGSGLTSPVRSQVNTHQPRSLTASFHPHRREVSSSACLCGLVLMTLNCQPQSLQLSSQKIPPSDVHGLHFHP